MLLEDRKIPGDRVQFLMRAADIAVVPHERALNSGGHLSGITTGLDSLNSKIGGLHPSDLIIIAGRPGMGKSSLATNIAFAAAQRFLRDAEDGIEPGKGAGAAVALFSLEMSADQLATRILAEQSGISSENLRMGKISQQEFRQLARAAGELQSLPLYIDDTPGLTIAALRARARRLKRQKGIGMVIIDYLQLLQGTGKNSNENRVQEISDISRSLKALARELKIPVVALSQLSRASEQRGGESLDASYGALSLISQTGDPDIPRSNSPRAVMGFRLRPSGRIWLRSGVAPSRRADGSRAQLFGRRTWKPRRRRRRRPTVGIRIPFVGAHARTGQLSVRL